MSLLLIDSRLSRWHVLSLFFPVFILFSGISPAPAGQEYTIVSVFPRYQESSPGETISVNITANPRVPVAGMQFSLIFDPAVVSVSRVQEGNLLNQNGASTYFSPGAINNTMGTITGVAGAITSPGQTVSSSGTFATVFFTVKTDGAISSLYLEDVIAGDNNGISLPVIINNGSIVLDPSLVKPGDVNKNGTIDVLDMTLTSRIIMSVENDVPGVDVNLDGKLDILDIEKILLNILEID